jgi:hypothetical protein
LAEESFRGRDFFDARLLDCGLALDDFFAERIGEECEGVLLQEAFALIWGFR